ncbi:MAG: flavin reductase family protein [Deltaproteobacteria bacterium]|jgi:flavin reductase (DIM6/NTAB) family NADH-FMN oxidoreductase RutF|nr:flavin reductase family protein [Deltaproteobacteria bacterium]
MKRSLGPQTLVYPLPVYLVGSYAENDRPNIMTAAWGGICCSEPPCLAVSVRKSRLTYAAVQARKAFTISVPPARLTAEADFAGLASGRDCDKFARLKLTPVRSELVDAPYVGECPLVLELALLHSLDLGSHVQFVGEIKDVKVEENCLDPAGKPDAAALDPLIYDGGGRQYFRYGEIAGKAFSTGKAFLSEQEFTCAHFLRPS